MTQTDVTISFRKRPLRANKYLELAGIYAALAVLTLQTVYPLLWVLFGSLKSKQEMMNNIWGPPADYHLANYADAWKVAGMGDRLFNSVMVTSLALALLVAAATPCAYALARLRFHGSHIILGVIVSAMLVPPQVMAIPLFVLARDLGLINSRIGISVIYAATTLPISIIIIFGFIEIWNDFFLAFLLLRQPAVQTIPLGLVTFFQQFDSLWNLYFAALMITTLPVIIIFAFMQRQFIAGLTAGATKG
jgi:raffinose/stachyose/melibiose transport system permease protein